MAGNTKLVGFLNDNRVQLERWGVRTIVPLDGSSVESLRAACINDLPRRPVQPSAENNDFRAAYDSALGRISIVLSVDAAAYLSDLLDVLVKDNVQAMTKVRPWVEALHAAVQAHKDFHTYEDEPGARP
jgi:hypothetical protein